MTKSSLRLSCCHTSSKVEACEEMDAGCEGLRSPSSPLSVTLHHLISTPPNERKRDHFNESVLQRKGKDVKGKTHKETEMHRVREEGGGGGAVFIYMILATPPSPESLIVREEGAAAEEEVAVGVGLMEMVG